MSPPPMPTGLIKAVKLYPAGATTNSASGVRDFDKVRGVLEKMAEIGLPLCVHGEVTDPEIDIFDREAVFIDRVLDPIRRATPGLRVVHGTCHHRGWRRLCRRDRKEPGRHDHHASPGASTATTSSSAASARITTACRSPSAETHRLALASRRDLGRSALLPRHRQRAASRSAQGKRLRLRRAASPRPTRCRCLAEVFETDGALDRLEGFTSLNGADLLRPAGQRRDDHADQGRSRRLSRPRSTPPTAPSPSSTPASRCTGSVLRASEYSRQRRRLRSMIPTSYPPPRGNGPPDRADASGNRRVHFNAAEPFTYASGLPAPDLYRLPQADLLPAHPLDADGFPDRHRDARRGLRGVRQHRRRRNRGHPLRRAGGRTAGAADDLCAQEAQGLRPQRPDRGRDDAKASACCWSRI